MKLTPVMQEYVDMKAENPNALLLYRLGDFYEIFFGDAIVASKALDIVLTKRGTDERGVDIPMCGIPHHAAENYVARLVKAGHSVAFAEQMETPEESKARGAKQILRKVVRIITAGTLIEDNLLPAKKSNFLMAISPKENLFEIAILDISTNEFLIGIGDNGDIERFSPAEILYDADHAELPSVIQIRNTFNTSPMHSREYNTQNGDSLPEKMIRSYFFRTQKVQAKLKRPKNFNDDKKLLIDSSTWKSLEITESMNIDGVSLIDIIDNTKTAAGARLLNRWITQPLYDIFLIEERQSHIDFLVKNPAVLHDLGAVIQSITDVTRAIARIQNGHGGPKDLHFVKNFINLLPDIKDIGLRLDPVLQEKFRDLNLFDSLKKELNDALSDNPPLLFRHGGIIKDGFNDELDKIRDVANGAKEAISKLSEEYTSRTSTPIKIKFNNIIGWFIEVGAQKAAPLQDVNSGFIHRQTMADTMRFTTEVLINFENEIKSAAQKSDALEIELIYKIIENISKHGDEIISIAKFLAEIDVYFSLATVAVFWGWVCPKIVKEPVFSIKNGRHPVVESMLRDKAETFVKNDCELGDTPIALLTGPNMSGKSTYLRQNAIIVILSHIGSFVPADLATIGLCDQLFSRVGASDNLASGQSTFMVEMSETANILNNMTTQSFIIFDEIGRGTATYDGMAIAQAVLEYTDKISPRCLFATHYHELTTLSLKNVKNMTVKVEEGGGDIIFMHKVINGIASGSYGIHVAKIAGMPPEVITNAEQILKKLDKLPTPKLEPLTLFN